VRFPSKCSALSAYDQQRATIKYKDDINNRILAHNRQVGPTLIPTGHTGNEYCEASFHKEFVSWELLRGKDRVESPTLFRDNINDIYEDLILNDIATAFQTPNDFIEPLVARIAAAEARGEATITLSPTKTLILYICSNFTEYLKSAGLRVHVPQSSNREYKFHRRYRQYYKTRE
jgi:hypothetical protein